MPEISAYDSIAAMYDLHWRNWYLPAALPALERLFFDRVPASAHVLDVCCGSGHVTRELVRRRYRVTGVDLSRELIEIARSNIAAEFLVADVRDLQIPRMYDAALSTFDALNHLLSLEDLRSALRGVHAVLRPGALFVFDMNLDEAYTLDLHNWHCTLDAENAFLVRGHYYPEDRLAQTELVWFIRQDGNNWSRRTSMVEERCYPEADILDALAEAGFQEIKATRATDVGVTPDVGFGRRYFSARA